MKTSASRALFVSLVLACLAPGLTQANSLDSWHWRNPLPQGHSLHSIAYGNGIFVAVGEFGTVLRSRDGTDWALGRSGTTEDLWSVTYGNGVFVAVGGSTFSPILLTSPDGVAWTLRDSGASRTLLGVAFGGSFFVAVGDQHTILSSPDGVSWKEFENLFRGNFRGVSHGNGTFVGVGGSSAEFFAGFITSRDAKTWDWQRMENAAVLNGIAFGAGRFVAVGDSGAVLTSTDGTVWAKQASGTSAALRTIVYGSNTFVAVGNAGTLLSSPDGITWTRRNSGTNFDLSGVVNGVGKFVAVGSFGVLLNSPDGFSWTRLDSGTRDRFNALRFGNSRFVAVGDGGAIFSSPDGAAWKNENAGTDNDLLSIGFGNGLFVAVGAAGTILTSRDGSAWTPQRVGLETRFTGVAYGKDRFVIVASNGPILSSSDGIQWTRTEVAAGLAAEYKLGLYDLRSVTFGNGTFIAVGEKFAVPQAATTQGDSAPTVFNYIYGPILVSADGVTWRDFENGAGFSLYGIAHGNGGFVAVGSLTVISDDAVSWKLGAAQGGNSIAFGDGQFVASGARGTIATASDGVKWTARTSGTSRNLTGIAFGNSTFVTVGDLGTILQTDSAVTPVPSLEIDPKTITNDYTGKVTFTIRGLASGQSVNVETYLDENSNGQLEPAEQFVHSVSVTDGLLPMIGGVRNLNVPGDEDGAANGVIRTELNLELKTEIDAIAGNYLFKVASSSPGFAQIVQSFTIIQKILPQGVNGTLLAGDSKTPLPGALLALFDEHSDKVTGSAFTDALGHYTLFSPPGTYVLLASKPGFIFDIGTGNSVLDALISTPGLFEIPANQMLQRNLTLSRGANSIVGTLRDLESGNGIAGMQFYGLGGSTNLTANATNLVLSLSFAYTDAQGNINMPVTAGIWTVAGLPKLAARLGYLVPSDVAPIDTAKGSIIRLEARLPKATALIHGLVQSEQGNPIAGVQVSAGGGSGYQTATSTDRSGRYTVGVIEGDWTVGFDFDELKRLGYEDQFAEVQIARNQSMFQNFVLRPAATPPVITDQPVSQTVNAGINVTFSVTARGAMPLKYQWWFNGWSISASATNATLTLTNVQPRDAGTYSVLVSNSAGSVASADAILKVTTALPSATISGFFPLSGAPGTTVTINGANLSGVTDVKFGNTSAGFIVLSQAQIITAVPADAATGPIAVVALSATLRSVAQFTVAAAANSPPTIRLDSPAPGEKYTAPANISVSATASDPGGAIRRVEYFDGGTLLYGIDTIQLSTVSTSFTWTNVAAGTHSVVAVATDDQGARSFSKALFVAVGGGPDPILHIARSGNEMELIWPANATGFFLETAASLSPPRNWMLVGTKSSVRGDQNVVIEAVAPGQRFYRLKRAP